MHKVGFVEGRCADEERRSWSGDGPRPLIWSAWYPAVDTAWEETRLIGPVDAPLFVMGRVVPGAPLSSVARLWPVVLLSHGTGGSGPGMGWLGCRLAAAGYIAIAVSHHGNTAAEPYRAQGFLCWWERARDLSVILDRLAAEGPFTARLDVSRVFAAGFSLGGYTVLALAGAITELALFEQWLAGQGGRGRGPREFPDLADHFTSLLATSSEFRASVARHGRAYYDPRVKAVLALAPAPPVRGFTPQSLQAVRLPVRTLVGGADAEAPAETCASWLAGLLPNCQLTLLGPDVGHYVFLCEATEMGRSSEPVLCVDAPGVDRGAIHDQVAGTAIALFRSEV
jgi:predicted dienelactone hydrolase